MRGRSWALGLLRGIGPELVSAALALLVAPLLGVVLTIAAHPLSGFHGRGYLLPCQDAG